MADPEDKITSIRPGVTDADEPAPAQPEQPAPRQTLLDLSRLTLADVAQAATFLFASYRAHGMPHDVATALTIQWQSAYFDRLYRPTH